MALCVAAGPEGARAECKSAAANALRGDAERATLWNWGWGGLFAISAVAHGSVALATDDADTRVALWTGATKSMVGTINQMIRPIRIYPPRDGCHELGPQLIEAAEIERKKRNWFAHASVVAVNVAAFSYVQYRTRDLKLSLPGAIVGTIVGELVIYSAPARVHRGGFAFDGVSVLPTFGREHGGLLVGAQF